MIAAAVFSNTNSEEEYISGDSYTSIENTSCVSPTYNTFEANENAITTSVENVSTDSIAVGFELLEETLVFRECNLINDIGEPILVEGNVYYFYIQTLFEKSGIMSVEVENGYVVRTTWTCEFVDDVVEGEEFYGDILKVTATMPYDNLNVCKNYENGVPRVSITVWK